MGLWLDKKAPHGSGSGSGSGGGSGSQSQSHPRSRTFTRALQSDEVEIVGGALRFADMKVRAYRQYCLQSILLTVREVVRLSLSDSLITLTLTL